MSAARWSAIGSDQLGGLSVVSSVTVEDAKFRDSEQDQTPETHRSVSKRRRNGTVVPLVQHQHQFLGQSQRMHKQMYLLTHEWDSAVTHWIERLIASGKPMTTIRTRRGHVRMVARRLRSRHPGDVTTDQILALAARQAWSPDHRRGLRTSLTQFFDYALKAGLVEINPANDLPTVSESKPRPRPVSDRMWMQLLSDADPRERMAARLAEEAGMRREEAAKCHTDDVIEAFDGYELVIHGKGGKQRIVPITDVLAKDILRGANGHTPGLGKTGYLFPGATGGHISADWIGKLVGRLLPQGWTMHKLRHRFATTMYRATGGNLMIVKELLGHESVATTQRYLAITNEELRAAVNARAAA